MPFCQLINRPEYHRFFQTYWNITGTCLLPGSNVIMSEAGVPYQRRKRIFPVPNVKTAKFVLLFYQSDKLTESDKDLK